MRIPRSASRSPSATSSTSTRASTKLVAEGSGSKPTARSSSDEQHPHRSHLVAPRVDRVAGAQARAARGQRRAVHVERLFEQVEVRHERLVDERVAEPQPGEPIELGEAAQDDHAPALHDVELAADAAIRRDEVGVRLVDDGDAAPGQGLEETLPFVRLERGAGRVVRVADPDDARIHLPRGLGESIEIDRELSHRHAMDRRTAGRRDLRVQAVREGRHHDVLARP